MKPSIPSKQVSFVAIIALVVIAILVTIAMAELFATASPNPNADFTFREEITTLKSSMSAIKSSAVLTRGPLLTTEPSQLNNSNTQSRNLEIPWLETEADEN